MTNQNTAKTAQKQPGLVPKLRFPEFKDMREWEEKPIKEIFTIFQGFAFSSNDSVPNGVRWLKIADVSIQKMNHESPSFLPLEHQQKYDKFSVYEGEYVLALTRPILNGQLKIAPVDKLFDGALLNQRVGKLVTEQSSSFVYYLLQTSKLITDIEKSISGSEPPNLSAQQIESLKTRVPDSPKEQQKIAECLASLDELIGAHSKKLEALKTYKKGLMQNLFPAQGQTTPQYRFPEFKNAGSWEDKILGDIGSVKMCKRILKEQTLPVGDVPFYKIGTFGSIPDAFITKELFEAYKNKFSFPKKGAVLISASGTIGRTVRYQGEDAYFQDSNIVWLENSNELVTDDFLFYLYQLITWKPSVGAIQRLYNETILCTQIKFPSLQEQQKIAACLSSLDNLITAQTQKIEALKQHKKGLMQQLFPSG